MEIADAFLPEVITETIKIHPRYLGSNIHDYVAGRVRELFEDRCSRHGYVKRGSIELRSLGTLQTEMQTFRGFVNANVVFTAMVCNPPEKSVVLATVKNVNTFGVLTVCEIDGKEVMQIVVPRNIVSIKSVMNMDRVAVGSKVSVEIIKRKIEVGEHILYGIGRIVSEDPQERESDEETDDTSETDDIALDTNDDDVEIELNDMIDVEDAEEEAVPGPAAEPDVIEDEDADEDTDNEEDFEVELESESQADDDVE